MIWIYNTQFYETRKIYSVEHCRVIESCSEFAEEDLIDLFENPRLFTLPFILSPSPSIIGGQPTPSESTIVWKGWNKLFRYMKVRSMDMEKRKVYLPNFNMSLNRRCWNTSMNSRRIWEKRDGLKGSHQRFLRPHFWGVRTVMQNWGLSLNNEILLWVSTLFLKYVC